ncbi:unnamed protein product [Chrysoparadoxa australica]
MVRQVLLQQSSAAADARLNAHRERQRHGLVQLEQARQRQLEELVKKAESKARLALQNRWQLYFSRPDVRAVAAELKAEQAALPKLQRDIKLRSSKAREKEAKRRLLEKVARRARLAVTHDFEALNPPVIKCINPDCSCAFVDDDLYLRHWAWDAHTCGLKKGIGELHLAMLDEEGYDALCLYVQRQWGMGEKLYALEFWRGAQAWRSHHSSSPQLRELYVALFDRHMQPHSLKRAWLPQEAVEVMRSEVEALRRKNDRGIARQKVEAKEAKDDKTTGSLELSVSSAGGNGDVSKASWSGGWKVLSVLKTSMGGSSGKQKKGSESAQGASGKALLKMITPGLIQMMQWEVTLHMLEEVAPGFWASDVGKSYRKEKDAILQSEREDMMKQLCESRMDWLLGEARNEKQAFNDRLRAREDNMADKAVTGAINKIVHELGDGVDGGLLGRICLQAVEMEVMDALREAELSVTAEAVSIEVAMQLPDPVLEEAVVTLARQMVVEEENLQEQAALCIQCAARQWQARGRRKRRQDELKEAAEEAARREEAELAAKKEAARLAALENALESVVSGQESLDLPAGDLEKGVITGQLEDGGRASDVWEQGGDERDRTACQAADEDGVEGKEAPDAGDAGKSTSEEVDGAEAVAAPQAGP